MTTSTGTRFLDYPAARQRMAEIIVEASRDPELIDFAIANVQNVATGDYPSEAAALAAIVRDCVRYTSDVSGEDLYKWPMLTLRQLAGDCNNKVLLFGALARAVGFPVRCCFLFTTANPDLEHDFPAHVFAAVDTYKGERPTAQWVPVELTPIPDKVNGFPSRALPFGSLPPIAGQYVDCYDVDQVAAAGDAMRFEVGRA